MNWEDADTGGKSNTFQNRSNLNNRDRAVLRKNEISNFGKNGILSTHHPRPGINISTFCRNDNMKRDSVRSSGGTSQSGWSGQSLSLKRDNSNLTTTNFEDNSKNTEKEEPNEIKLLKNPGNDKSPYSSIPWGSTQVRKNKNNSILGPGPLNNNENKQLLNNKNTVEKLKKENCKSTGLLGDGDKNNKNYLTNSLSNKPKSDWSKSFTPNSESSWTNSTSLLPNQSLQNNFYSNQTSNLSSSNDSHNNLSGVCTLQDSPINNSSNGNSSWNNTSLLGDGEIPIKKENDNKNSISSTGSTTPGSWYKQPCKNNLELSKTNSLNNSKTNCGPAHNNFGLNSKFTDNNSSDNTNNKVGLGSTENNASLSTQATNVPKCSNSNFGSSLLTANGPLLNTCKTPKLLSNQNLISSSNSPNGSNTGNTVNDNNSNTAMNSNMHNTTVSSNLNNSHTQPLSWAKIANSGSSSLGSRDQIGSGHQSHTGNLHMVGDTNCNNSKNGNVSNLNNNENLTNQNNLTLLTKNNNELNENKQHASNPGLTLPNDSDRNNPQHLLNNPNFQSTRHNTDYNQNNNLDNGSNNIDKQNQTNHNSSKMAARNNFNNIDHYSSNGNVINTGSTPMSSNNRLSIQNNLNNLSPAKPLQSNHSNANSLHSNRPSATHLHSDKNSNKTFNNHKVFHTPATTAINDSKREEQEIVKDEMICHKIHSKNWGKMKIDQGGKSWNIDNTKQIRPEKQKEQSVANRNNTRNINYASNNSNNHSNTSNLSKSNGTEAWSTNFENESKFKFGHSGMTNSNFNARHDGVKEGNNSPNGHRDYNQNYKNTDRNFNQSSNNHRSTSLLNNPNSYKNSNSHNNTNQNWNETRNNNNSMQQSTNTRNGYDNNRENFNSSNYNNQNNEMNNNKKSGWTNESDNVDRNGWNKNEENYQRNGAGGRINSGWDDIKSPIAHLKDKDENFSKPVSSGWDQSAGNNSNFRHSNTVNNRPLLCVPREVNTPINSENSNANVDYNYQNTSKNNWNNSNWNRNSEETPTTSNGWGTPPPTTKSNWGETNPNDNKSGEWGNNENYRNNRGNTNRFQNNNNEWRQDEKLHGNRNFNPRHNMDRNERHSGNNNWNPINNHNETEDWPKNKWPSDENQNKNFNYNQTIINNQNHKFSPYHFNRQESPVPDLEAMKESLVKSVSDNTMPKSVLKQNIYTNENVPILYKIKQLTEEIKARDTRLSNITITDKASKYEVQKLQEEIDHFSKRLTSYHKTLSESVREKNWKVHEARTSRSPSNKMNNLNGDVYKNVNNYNGHMNIGHNRHHSNQNRSAHSSGSMHNSNSSGTNINEKNLHSPTPLLNNISNNSSNNVNTSFNIYNQNSSNGFSNTNRSNFSSTSNNQSSNNFNSSIQNSFNNKIHNGGHFGGSNMNGYNRGNTPNGYINGNGYGNFGGGNNNSKTPSFQNQNGMINIPARVSSINSMKQTDFNRFSDSSGYNRESNDYINIDTHKKAQNYNNFGIRNSNYGNSNENNWQTTNINPPLLSLPKNESENRFHKNFSEYPDKNEYPNKFSNLMGHDNFPSSEMNGNQSSNLSGFNSFMNEGIDVKNSCDLNPNFNDVKVSYDYNFDKMDPPFMNKNELSPTLKTRQSISTADLERPTHSPSHTDLDTVILNTDIHSGSSNNSSNKSTSPSLTAKIESLKINEFVPGNSTWEAPSRDNEDFDKNATPSAVIKYHAISVNGGSHRWNATPYEDW